MGYLPYQVVQVFFFHQQYFYVSNEKTLPSSCLGYIGDYTVLHIYMGIKKPL